MLVDKFQTAGESKIFSMFGRQFLSIEKNHVKKQMIKYQKILVNIIKKFQKKKHCKNLLIL